MQLSAETAQSYRLLLQQWENMTNGQTVGHPLLRATIKESWDRSKAFGLTPYDPHFSVLPDDLLQAKKKYHYKWLLDIAKPYMKQLYQFVAGSGFIITLNDENGYVLELVGDNNAFESAKQISLVPGVNWSEHTMGTSGIGICLATKKPIQLWSAEHYLQICHSWTCSAAPILSADGRLLGVLNMSANADKVHSHTLGMVVAAAQAITRGLEAYHIRKSQEVSNNFFQIAFENVSEGLIFVDQKGVVKQINSSAQQLLNICPDSEQLLPEETVTGLRLNETLVHGRQMINEKVHLDFPSLSRKGNLLVTSSPIRNDQTIIGAVMILRKTEPIREIANQAPDSNSYFTFDNILGESPSIKKAIQLAASVADFSSHVLLMGETGTGKEMFAQAIHNASKRRSGPFIAVNCASIPRELVSSELFGYQEGAFTGARRNGSPGKFELAHGGTIFLDEIEDMPLEHQPVLLRVLEEKKVTRISGRYPIPVDVRVIASTNLDLLDKVNNKGFRRDLFYRLNVICIQIPPLRERREDIPLLTEYFLKKFNKKLAMKAFFTQETLQALKQYDWPGNVRELENTVQYAIFLSGGKMITPDHLPCHAHPKRTEETLSLKITESDYIKKALEVSQGDTSKAAKMLGISRTTLYRKLKKT